MCSTPNHLPSHALSFIEDSIIPPLICNWLFTSAPIITVSFILRSIQARFSSVVILVGTLVLVSSARIRSFLNAEVRHRINVLKKLHTDHQQRTSLLRTISEPPTLAHSSHYPTPRTTLDAFTHYRNFSPSALQSLILKVRFSFCFSYDLPGSPRSSCVRSLFTSFCRSSYSCVWTHNFCW